MFSRHRSITKILSIVLVISMLFSTMVIAPVVTSAYATSEIDYTQLMLDNYSDLNEGEKALLGSGVLKSGKLQYNAPTQEDVDSLITVNPDDKTLSCDTYTDSCGNVWVPNVVKVVYDGGEELITLDSTGNATFSYEGNAYNIWANYSLDITVGTDDQQKLLDVAVNLVQGYEGMEGIVDNVETIRMLENNIDDLKQLADGYNTAIGVISFTNEDYVAAVTELSNQKKTNGHFTYINLVADLGNSASKTQFLIEHGDELRTAAVQMTEYLDAIVKYQSAIETNINFLQLLGVSTTLVNLLFNELALTSTSLKSVCGESNWAINTADVFVDDVDYSAIDAIADKLSSTPSSVELTDTFHIADAQLTKNLNRYNVTIQVNAKVVNPTTNEIVALTSVEKILPLNSGTSKTEIESAISNSLTEEEALSTWNAQNTLYVIDDTNYVRSTDSIPDTLTSDIVYTITYEPALVSTTADNEMGLPTEVPFGTYITLPKLGEEERVYDYKVNGTAYDEGSSVRITEPVTITRNIGAAWNYITLNSIVASSINDEESADILNQTAVASELVRLRKPSGNLVTVEFDSNTSSYGVVAKTFSSGLGSSNWIPVSVNVIDENGNVVSTVTMSKTGSNYTGSFGMVGFDHVEVDYALDISNVVSQSKLLTALNIPDNLVKEAVDQKEAINQIDSQYSSLQSLNGQAGMLRTAINGAVDDEGNYLLTEEIKQAGLDLVKNCFNSVTGNLYIYEYLTAYHQSGLVWLYHQTADGKYDNYESFVKQIEIFKSDLPSICDEENVFKNYLDSFEYDGKNVGEYYDRLVELVEKVETLDLESPNTLINGTKSDELSELVDAIERAEGSTRQYTTTDGVDFVLHETISANAPDRAGVTVNVTVTDADGKVTATYTKSKTYAFGTVLTDADISAIESLTASIVADIDTNHYEMDASSDAMIQTGTTLNSDKVININYIPKTYTVSFEASGFTANIPDAAFKYGNNTIEIPAFNESGIRYDFAIGSETVSTTIASVSYVFTKAQIDNLFENGTYTVVVTRADESLEKLIRFIDSINNSLSDNTITVNGRECQKVVAYPVQDANGKISIVFRITAGEELDLEGFVSGIAEAIVNSEYDEIKVTDEVLFSNLTSKVSLPAVFNTLFNSGLSISQIPNMIDENGNLAEMNLEGVCLKTVDANNEFTVGNNVVRDVTTYGAELFNTTLGLDAETYDCYFTLEDFDESASRLKDTRDAANKLLENIDIALEDDGIKLDVTLPELSYDLLLAGLVATDNASIHDINNIDLATALEYIYNTFIPTITDEAVSYNTIENTVSEINSETDVSGLKTSFTSIQSILRDLTSNSSIAKDSNGDDIYGSVGSLFKASYQFNLDPLVDSMLGSNASSFSRFIEAGMIDYNLELKLNNADSDYDALVINTKADDFASKVKTYKDGETGWTDELLDQSIIILLSDATENIVTDKKVYVDLNGFTLNGNIEGSNIVLLDSTINNSGSVTGTVSVKTDKRTNEYYYLEENGDKISVVFNSALFNADNSDSLTDVKTVAFEALFDIVLNYFTTASLKINDNNIYDINVDNLILLFKNSDSSNISELINSFDSDGITAFINEFISALADFGGIATAIENNQPIFSANIEVGAWDIYTSHDEDNDKIAAGVKSSADKKNQTIEFVAGGTAEEKTKAKEFFSVLSSIATININVGNGNISYVNHDVSVKADETADIVLDFTDPVYPVALSILVAAVNGGSVQNDVVDAVEYYFSTGLTNKLKEVVDSFTMAQLVSAANAFDSTTDIEQLISDLGLDSVVDSSISDRIDDLRIALNAICAVLRLTGENGSSAKVSDFEKDFGTYELFDGSETLSGDRVVYSSTGVNFEINLSSVKATIKIFSEDPLVTVKDGKSIIYRGESLADAISAATEGSEIIITDNVTLDADATVNSNITISGADKIDASTKVIYINDNASITFVPSIPSGLVFEAKNSDNYSVSTENNTVSVEKKPCMHVWGNGIVSIPSTCTTEGTMIYTCTLCQEISTVTIPMKKHTSGTAVRENEVPAQVGIDGSYDEVVYCTVCGGEISRENKVIPMIPVDPEWNGTSPTVSGNIYGSKVDNTNKYIYLDISPDGITWKEVKSLLNFSGTADNATDYVLTISDGGTSVNPWTNKEVVRNGASFEVKATNSASSASITETYTIIIMGDTNCNGYSDAGDCRMIQMHILEQRQLTGAALLAGNINQVKIPLNKDEIDSGDARKVQSKVLSASTYVTSLK